VFAHISDADVQDWQSSIDIVLRRFAEYHDLQGAFGRRALIERAKGILMEGHSIDEDDVRRGLHLLLGGGYLQVTGTDRDQATSDRAYRSAV
jgi:hypothetical protein